MQRLQLQFHALGSDVFITLVADDHYSFDTTFQVLHEQIAAFEQRFSRFLPSSELTSFNTNAGKLTKVSAEFLELLQTCAHMAKSTNGIYNPFVLPALQKAGYLGSWPSPQNLTEATDFSDRLVVPYTELKIIEDSAHIPAHSAIDFGGIGKGYLLDRLSAYLQPHTLDGYWLSLGGDIVCAGNDLDNQAWSIQVQHATKQEKLVTTLTNDSGTPLFIATSGITKRRGENSSGSWHHIINPQTGLPANTDILTATVTSTVGVKADVHAKTIVIADREQAQKLKDSGEIGAFILQYQAKEPTIEL